MAQGADALSNRIGRVPKLGVLPHEHGVQGVVWGPSRSVKLCTWWVQGVGIGQQVRKPLGDGRAVFVADTDVDSQAPGDAAGLTLLCCLI